jgi:hypothetical protein
MAIVALFGPLSNFLLASVVAVIIRFNNVFGFSSHVTGFLITIVYLNVL